MLSERQAQGGLEFISQRIAILATPLSIVSRALTLGSLLGHSVYDCIYLSLCEAESARFATYDEELVRRARRANLGHLLVELPLGAGD